LRYLHAQKIMTKLPGPMSAPELPLLHPLDDYYARAGRALPSWEAIEGQLVPEPQKTLLVHQNDMTSTLEKFYGRGVHLHVLGRRRAGDVYFREVLLRLDGTDQPVEFGAIRINLALFTPEARAEILGERELLADLLAKHRMPYASRPAAYLRVVSDPLINGILGLSGPQVLYGRRDTLLDRQNRPLAEVVEILPPSLALEKSKQVRN
jgi:hypothetical protein